MAAMWKSSRPAVAEPASIRAPISVLRAVMTPLNGAWIFSKPCSCSSRRTFAAFESTVAFVALSVLTAWSVSCLDTESLSSSAWCSWCMDATEYLTERGYQFTEIDVGRDRDAYDEMRELSDQTYVPTLVAGDAVLANFDTDQLEAFLNEHGIKP